MSALITAKDVSVRFDGLEVVSHVDLAVERGEILTIVGPNGSGKTTLLRVLIGAVQPSEGKVIRAPRLTVGYTPQKLTLDPRMPIDVDRFVALAARSTSKAREAALERVGLGGLGGRQMAELSGGQFQRALLAHALVRRPDLLALDEPTAGLDQPGVAAFYQLVAELRQELGCAVVMVSHDLHVVMSASDRVICLNHHICCEGTPTVVSAAPEYRALFGLGTEGALALYRHVHDHRHDPEAAHDHHHDHHHEERP